MSEASALTIREPSDIELGTLRADTPAALLAAATAISTPLAKLISDRELYSRIQGRDYVKCEGWTTMGAMLGVIPQEVSNVCDEHGVYVATVELVNIKTGAVVGRASAECGNPDETGKDGKPLWASRAAYARRSMAATRATGKAFRLSFSWIMCMAGYQPTPAEEMDVDSEHPAGPLSARWPGNTGHPGNAPRQAAPKAGGDVWIGKLVKMSSKDGETNGRPWTLFKFTAADGTAFGTFSDTDAEAISKLDGRFVEITYEVKKNGNHILSYRDANADEVPV